MIKGIPHNADILFILLVLDSKLIGLLKDYLLYV